ACRAAEASPATEAADSWAVRRSKEAVHELGHRFGLVHCADQRCVMRASSDVEEVDLKSAESCGASRGCSSS
ncbi:MAG TPA: hypothetical protein VNL18_15025, partial [Gemmatimonadales bacterium]|nr:hypothetical protein [Gemmatimonadales bacterium]